MTMISNNDTFWYLILADLLHTTFLAFFFYEYKASVKGGGAPILAFTNDARSGGFGSKYKDS
jgi:hypothetical protein